MKALLSAARRSPALATFLLLAAALPLAAQEPLPTPAPAAAPAQDNAQVEIAGNVYLGREAQAAELEFLTGAGKVKVAADDSGHYRLRATPPLRQVKIELKSRPGQFFQQIFFEAPRTSGAQDFHLPDTELRITLRDAATGQPIPAASLKVRNTYAATDLDGKPLPPRRPGDPAPTRTLAQLARADAQGVASLSYLQPGELELQAEAEGYHDLAAPQKLSLTEKGRLAAELRLQAFAQPASLDLLLPDGEKAAGAIVLVLESLEPLEAVAHGIADAQGRVELPRDLAGKMLAVRHPAAAFLLGRWQPADAPAIASLRLEPAATELVVHASSGAKDLAYAELVVWAGGQRLSSHLLYQLTGSRPMTDEAGWWRGSSLPRSGVRVLAFSRADAAKADAARSGQFDAQATAIAYPWPARVEVQGLE